ncbi:MAG: DnaJ domain-containing protein [Ignavibacteria bacterium]|nr:DnaJ domain-containing protein [Ignavibacteria bacterium]
MENFVSLYITDAAILTNYYQILELSQSATITEVKAAFRRLSFKFHPDLNNEADAEENFKKVNEAYQILSDPFLRQLYDKKIEKNNFTQTNNFSQNIYRYPVNKNKTNNSYRNVIFVFLLFIAAFLIFQAASSLSTVNAINAYKSNLSKKANEFYLHSQQRDKQIDIIIRRTNSLVDMFRNIPK